MYTFSFERLDVWKKSRNLAKRIYELTRLFPDLEKFGISSQLRRAAISICSNIAEGSSRISKKDQAHFYNMAYSSLMETLNQIILCDDFNYIDNKVLLELRKEITTVSILLEKLCRYARNTVKKDSGIRSLPYDSNE